MIPFMEKKPARATVRDILVASIAYVERYNIYAAMDVASTLVTYLPIHKKKMLRIAAVHVHVCMQTQVRHLLCMHLWYLNTYYGSSFRCFGQMVGQRPGIWRLIRMSTLNISFKIVFYTKNMVTMYNKTIVAHRIAHNRFGHSYFFAEMRGSVKRTYSDYFIAVKQLQKICTLYTDLYVSGFFLNNIVYTINMLVQYEQRLCIYKTVELLNFFKKIACIYLCYFFIHIFYLVFRYLLVCLYEIYYIFYTMLSSY